MTGVERESIVNPAGIGNNSFVFWASILRLSATSIRFLISAVNCSLVTDSETSNGNKSRCGRRMDALTSSLAFLSSILSSYLRSELFSLYMFCMRDDQALFSTPLSRCLSRAEKDV